MLVLTRKLGESLKVGDDITVKILSVRRSRVQIGISAPIGIRVQRIETVEESAIVSEEQSDMKE